MPKKIPCKDGLRYRALAKAKGDYEAHQVAQCSNAYASWCDDGNANLAKWAEKRLQMFVDTPLRWKEVCVAVGGQQASPGAKQILRIRKKLGRWMTPDEREQWRKANRESTPKSDSTNNTVSSAVSKAMARFHQRVEELKAEGKFPPTPKSDSTASTTHENPKSDKLTSCPTDSD